MSKDVSLPNRDRAHIDRRKLTEYLLNADHPDAKGKSAFWTMKELERFILTEDLPDHGLRAGDLGTIVMTHEPGGDYTGPKGYTAEFTWDVRAAKSLCLKIQDGTHFSPKLGGDEYLYVTSKHTHRVTCGNMGDD